jgi:hypothetical protein
LILTTRGLRFFVIAGLVVPGLGMRNSAPKASSIESG